MINVLILARQNQLRYLQEGHYFKEWSLSVKTLN